MFRDAVDKYPKGVYKRKGIRYPLGVYCTECMVKTQRVLPRAAAREG